MDSGFSIKPRDSVVRTALGRGNSVRTDLAPSQSVNAAQQAFGSHHAPTERDPGLDPQCQSLLDREREQRERNERKRQRVRKDEALLRQKAYTRQADTPQPTHDVSTHADFEHADFEI